MANRVHRVTMFKIPSAEDQLALIDKYRTLIASHQRNGKPYILSTVVGAAEDDPRSQGFTLVSKTEFASMDDMKYYDHECPAHQALKDFAKTLTIQGVLTVFFEPQAVS